MARQIITTADVREYADAGCTELRFQPTDIVTDAAAEFAQQRGIRIIRLTGAEPEEAPPAPQPGQAPQAPARSAEQIKKAVIQALGKEPENLGQIVAKVLRS